MVVNHGVSILYGQFSDDIFRSIAATSGQGPAPLRHHSAKTCYNRLDGVSVVAVRPFHALVSLLRLDAERGDRSGFKTADADRFVRFLAIAIGAVVVPVESGIDL